MPRYMPRSNMPVNEARAGDFDVGFPDIAGLRNDEWQIYFNDFLSVPPGGTEAFADAPGISVEWTAADVATNTDVADFSSGGGHSLMVIPTDGTDTDGLVIQATSAMVQAIAGRTILFEALVGVDDVSECGVFVGINEIETTLMATTEAVNLDNGVGFRLLSDEGTGTWACVHGGSTGDLVDAGDAGTSTDATITAGSNANFTRLGFKLVGATPTVEWFFNGVSVQTTTATIFDAASTVSFAIVSDGAVETLWVDYVMLAQTRG